MIPDRNIAIIDWTHLIEDYLDNIGLTFDEFKNEMTGGWLFGYLQALKEVGYKPTFFCFSANENHIGNHIHWATKTQICVLPTPQIYRFLRSKILNPYTENVTESVRNITKISRPLYSLLLFSAEYFATPFLKLNRELSNRKIETILCQDYEHGRFDIISLLVKLTKRKVFATFQGGYPGNKFKSFFRNKTINLADGIICGSGKEIARLEQDYNLPQTKIAKIFNPLEVETEQNIDRAELRKKLGVVENTKVAVWHGRIDLYRKGLDLLIEVWQKICQKNFPFETQLMLLGYGNEAQKFRQLLDSIDNPTIKWLDEYTNDRAKIRDFLAAGDVYVFPSRHEGFPVAPIEAMSVGLPLLATNAQGISDILENGKDSGGIIVNLEDVEALADNLEALFLNDELRLQIGKNAQKRVIKSFSSKKVGLQLKEFLSGNVK